jgi:hypothetical protein
MSEQMVLQRGNSWAAIQQRCWNNQKLKTFSIIHKLAQELNKKERIIFKWNEMKNKKKIWGLI